MPIDVVMPRLGLTMTAGTLVRWLAEDGEAVKQGQPIFEIETDKAVVEAKATADGVLHPLAQAGSTIPVTDVVGQILADGEAAAPPPQAIPALDTAPIRHSFTVFRTASERSEESLTEASSRPQEMLRSAQHDELSVAAAVPETERIPLSGMRAIIAQRMAASAHQTAAVTLTTEADATELVALRTRLNESPGERLGFRISYNDILLKIVARCLRDFPYMNARLDGEAICRLPEVHVGLAVDTPRGLLVPVVRHADRLSIAEIGRSLRSLIERAQAGKSLPDDLNSGTFTVSNLGAFGVDAFTPIINLPETAILGIGRIVEKPVVDDNRGGVTPPLRLSRCLVLSLTFDHRLVDGAPAACFLQHITKLIEKPCSLI